MAIYYWNNQGRLGNLLFQYAAVEFQTKKDDIIFCFDSELFKAINVKRNFIKIPKVGLMGKLLNMTFNNFIDLLAKFKIITSIFPDMVYMCEGYTGETKKIIKKDGFFKNLIQIKGFFQHDEWIVSSLELKKEKIFEARKRLEKISQSTCKVAVHIRLSDYKNWVVLGKMGATIDASWYREAMNLMIDKFNNPIFIFFTDDTVALQDLNFGISPIIYIGKDAIDDMAAISLCEHAIISPSTLAYCGAVAFSKVRKVIIAPKYWAGFKSKLWAPSMIKTDLIQYLEVSLKK